MGGTGISEKYAEAVFDNKFTTWADSLPEVPDSVQSEIRKVARELFPEIVVPIRRDLPGYIGKKIAIFDDWAFKQFPGTTGPSYLVDLPKVDPKNGQSLWPKGRDAHREWLDKYFLEEMGYPRPDNYQWHHHYEPGKMQLVERGIHTANGHDGAFVSGAWADSPGKVNHR